MGKQLSKNDRFKNVQNVTVVFGLLRRNLWLDLVAGAYLLAGLLWRGFLTWPRYHRSYTLRSLYVARRCGPSSRLDELDIMGPKKGKAKKKSRGGDKDDEKV